MSQLFISGMPKIRAIPQLVSAPLTDLGNQNKKYIYISPSEKGGGGEVAQAHPSAVPKFVSFLEAP